MTRRLALAVALAFTTVVTFAMVAIGAQAGLFGGGGSDGAPADAAAGEATPSPEPTVITEYIYIDQTVTPEAGSAPLQGGSDSPSDSGSDVSQSDGVDADDAAFEEHDDDEREHEEFEHEGDDD